MKNWLRKKLRAFLTDDSECGKAISDRPMLVSREDDFGNAKNINFNLYYATGGVVIRTHRFDHKTDRAHNSMYVIRDDQNLAEELSRLITVESMR